MLKEAFRALPRRLQVKFAAALAGNATGAEHLLELVAEGQAPAAVLLERAVKDKLLAAKPANLEERLARLRRAARIVSELLAPFRQHLLPRDLEVASMLVLKTTVVMSFTWATDHAADVDSGAFQHEIATMLTRYLLAEPGIEPYRLVHPPPRSPSQIVYARPADVPGPQTEPRKEPRQARSAETVAILVEATRRVLVREGLAGVTTTRVALEAGVSIGTVYQYFPTAEALIAAWEEQCLGQMLSAMFERVSEAFTRTRGAPLSAAAMFGIATNPSRGFAPARSAVAASAGRSRSSAHSPT